MRAEKAASSSSDHKKAESESKDIAKTGDEAKTEQKETYSTSDTTSSYSAESVMPDEDIEALRKKCLDELGLPMNEIDNVMLSLYLEIGNLSHACDFQFLGMEASIEAEMPKAVTALHTDTKYTYKRPSVFVLTSTNDQTKGQWTATCQDLEKIGLEVVPVLGLDGEEVPCMAQAWRRAQTAWALKGFPFIQKCINKTASNNEQQDWFIIAEDSAKLFPQASIEAIQERLRNVPQGVEILQTGYRRCAEKRNQCDYLIFQRCATYVRKTNARLQKILDKKYLLPRALGSDSYTTGCSKENKSILTHPCVN